jgi:hypothetical protein
VPTTNFAVQASTVAALAVTMSIGLATTPAHAAPLGMSSQITYHPVSATDNHVYVVDIQGLVTMSQAAAQDSINHGYSIELRYWGDDPDSDDLLAGPVKPQIVSAAADGLHFQHSRTFSISQLDEDDSVLDSLADSESDEIYVGARLLDPSGKTVSLAESNRIVDNF